MKTRPRNEIYDMASEKWGSTSQLVVALEELAELSVEIAKKINDKRDSNEPLIDELADARIMIEQVENIFGVETEVQYRIEQKLARLEGIINNGE